MFEPRLPASVDDVDLSDIEFWLKPPEEREGASDRSLPPRSHDVPSSPGVHEGRRPARGASVGGRSPA